MARGKPKKLRMLWIVWDPGDFRWLLREGGKQGEIVGRFSSRLDYSIWLARRYCREDATPDRPIRLQKFNHFRNKRIAKGFEATYPRSADPRRRKG